MRHGFMKNGSHAKSHKNVCRKMQILVMAAVAVACCFVACDENGGNAVSEALKDSIVTLRCRGNDCRDESRFEEALTLHNEGLKMAKRAKDTIEWIQALNNIGTDFRRMGLFDVAQRYHYEAWRMSEESADTSWMMKKNRVVSLNGLGNVFLTIKNYQRADSAFRLALKGEAELGSLTGQAINYSNIGAIFKANGDDDKALECFRHSMELNRRDSNRVGIALCHTNFGSLYEKQGRYEDARKEYLAAFELIVKTKDRWHAMTPLLALASVDIDTKRYAEAKEKLLYAEEMVKSLNSKEHQMEIQMLWYKFYNSRGRYREALAHHVMAAECKDSLIDNDKNNRILNIGFSVERRRQQRQMALTKAELAEEKARSQVGIIVFVAMMAIFLVVVLMMVLVQRLKASRHRLLLETSRQRELFYTNITHEFRTPLTVILGLSKDIAEGKVSQDDVAAKAMTINRHGSRLMALITQIMEITKIKSGLVEPEWTNGNIEPFLQMVVSGLSDYAQGRGIHLTFEGCGKVVMDYVPDYINKVVTNLVSNALKFTDSGGSVVIKTCTDGKSLSLDVTDTGEGMTAERMKMLFTPFCSDNSGRNNSGIGVGLALVKQIVESLDGNISVESEVGKGSSFHVVLPIHQKAKSSETAATASVADTALAVFGLDDNACKARSGKAVKGRKLLIVIDDNADVAEYIASQLNDTYNICISSDGKEGMEKIRELMPDLVICDLMMPLVDGLEVCRQLKADMLTNHIPVVLVTAKITDNDRISGFAAGADDYIAKPFNADELKIRVGNLLEQRRVMREKFSSAVSSVMPYETSGESIVNMNTADDMERRSQKQNALFLSKAADTVMSMLDACEDVNVASLAEKMCMNPRQLHRKMTSISEWSPNEFIQHTKIMKAQRLLSADNVVSLKKIAYECGFSDYSHFARVFKSITGETPSKYKEGGRRV